VEQSQSINCCVKVRSVKDDELNCVYEIELESFDNPYPAYYFRVLMSLSSGRFFLVSEDSQGRITGYIAAVPLANRVCHIASIAVSRECRGKKVGACLLESLVEVCSGEGYDAFVLEVEYSNEPAISLYRSAGFKVVGVKPNYYGAGRHAIVMLLVESLGWKLA
jgi:ribosomal-protein-alanine N-acetyltransferase